MHKNLFRSAPLALIMLAGCADPSANEAAQTLSLSAVEGDASMADGTRILRSAAGALTERSSELPLTVATDFLLNNTELVKGEELELVGQTRSRNGVVHLRFQQRVDGLKVFGAYAKVAINPAGQVIQAIDKLVPSTGKVLGAHIDESDAVIAAMENLGYRLPASGELTLQKVEGNSSFYARTAELYRAPSVERVAHVSEDGSLRLGFVVETWTQKDNILNHTLINGYGDVLDVELRTAFDSYNVFVEDPLKGAQTVVNGPAAGGEQSPAGWLGAGNQTTTNISGNNANAYLDKDANNGPDAGGAPVSDGNFLTPSNLTVAPDTTENKAVAVQNLFYLNNVVHDILYSAGFNEAAMNFQVNNFGKGGAGNDPVLAEAQDGSGTDNANFSTPADGSSPRMQMYLWTGRAPNSLVTISGTTWGAYQSSFGGTLSQAGTNGGLAIYNDGTGVSSDACEASVGTLSGKVALVDRGTCDFTVKVMNAQKAGAVAVVIANNVTGAAFNPGGSNAKIRIPSAMVTLEDGAVIRTKAGTSTNLKANPVTPLQVDGDLDADIVFHEYGHGLTWRMIGSMSGSLAGAIGEGASDVVAYLINGDDTVAEYSYSSAGGIRRYPYADYPLTYSSVTGTGVHNDGEIYAGAMYNVLQNYVAAGLTPMDVMHDFVDGMNYTPATPAYEDMRDGMLQSTAGTGRECLIWRGFAESGIGQGADGTISRRGVLTITESFTVPANCQ